MMPRHRTVARLLARPATIALLLYQIAFLNLFLPGHTRGEVRLDGKPAACCCGPAAKHAATKDRPTQDDRHECAVCQFAAGLTPHVYVRLTLAPLGVLHMAPPPAVPVAADLVPTYYAHGPPTRA